MIKGRDIQDTPYLVLEYSTKLDLCFWSTCRTISSKGRQAKKFRRLSHLYACRDPANATWLLLTTELVQYTPPQYNDAQKGHFQATNYTASLVFATMSCLQIINTDRSGAVNSPPDW